MRGCSGSNFNRRLAKFGLELHPEKTRLIEFGRFAAANRKERGEGKPETFDFLGVTHYCAKRRNDGGSTVRRKTIAKKMRAKLKEVRQKLGRKRHLPVSIQGQWLRSVIRGHFNYYGVPGNTDALNAFRTQAIRAWLKALRYRSQKGKSLKWTPFERWVAKWIPSVRIVHPYPNKRFCV